MATSYQVAEALEVVSEELTATLNGARSALEQYVEQEQTLFPDLRPGWDSP